MPELPPSLFSMAQFNLDNCNAIKLSAVQQTVRLTVPDAGFVNLLILKPRGRYIGVTIDRAQVLVDSGFVLHPLLPDSGELLFRC